jgi:probable rRNA maturation factor
VPGTMTQNSSRTVAFVLLNRQRGHRANRKDMADFLDRLTRELRPDGDFSVVLVSDRAMRRYNHEYRGLDTATDVLSFPGDDPYLGDILISVDTASRQALGSRTLSFETNLKRLALHGLLHLMGYDHETDEGEMRAVETRLRRRLKC